MSDESIHRQMALDYLAAELHDDAPKDVTAVASFDESPLEGEGRVTVFSFQASPGGNPEAEFYVLAGQTTANYYPGWNLDPDEIYSVHLGTRFMLVVEVAQWPVQQLSTSLGDDIVRELADAVPGEAVSGLRPVAAFKAEDQFHAVWCCRIGDEDVYVLGGDMPLGIYRRTDLPPHVVYRLHLGSLIRLEREP